MPTTHKLILEKAKELASRNPDWVTFFREILGIDGVARNLLRDDEFARFEQSSEYTLIQKILTELRQQRPNPGHDIESTRVITLQVPKMMHEMLREKARELKTSINKLCISALLQPVPDQPQLNRARQIRNGSSSTDDPKRVMTVRLPKSLHEVLRAEAENANSKMDVICIAKLLSILGRKVSTDDAFASDVDPLALLLNPGAATKDEIADLLFEFSKLYRLAGGRGIRFSIVDARQPALAEDLL